MRQIFVLVIGQAMTRGRIDVADGRSRIRLYEMVTTHLYGPCHAECRASRSLWRGDDQESRRQWSKPPFRGDAQRPLDGLRNHGVGVR